MRGDVVVVRDYRGNALIRREWQDLGDRVVVTDDAGLASLAEGDPDAPQIAIASGDLFVYDAGMADLGERPDWKRMKPRMPQS